MASFTNLALSASAARHQVPQPVVLPFAAIGLARLFRLRSA
jgi:hypothetical protein